jgi:hypothetical protein
MFDIPGFDIKSMSDDELLTKQHTIAQKISILVGVGGAPEAIQQLRAMSNAIDTERAERIFVDVWKIRQGMFPKVIETDPSMRQSEGSEEQVSDKKSKSRPNRPLPSAIMRRTANPVADTEKDSGT